MESGERATTEPGKTRGLIGRRFFLCRPRWRCTTPYVGVSSHVLHSVIRWMGPVFKPRKDVDCLGGHEVPSPPRSCESPVCALSVSIDDECHRQDLQRILWPDLRIRYPPRLPNAFCPRQHVHKKGEAGKNLAYASQHRHLHPTSACPSVPSARIGVLPPTMAFPTFTIPSQLHIATSCMQIPLQGRPLKKVLASRGPLPV